MSASKTYEDAIETLNSLQTNANILDSIRKSRGNLNLLSLPETIEFLERLNYKPADLNKINLIHVAGTKGKGSTCAFCTSILNNITIHGSNNEKRKLKTGLYTSPHIMEVRERIRINGQPLSKDLFTKYFFETYNMFEETKEEAIKKGQGEKPTYFRFLTLMAFHTFLREKVDVGIIEAGIGGEYDSTNIIDKPVVCGITSLGIDHQHVLGNTLEEIAWHKSGIMKKNIPVVTAYQLPKAMEVIKKRAVEKEAKELIIAEDIKKIRPFENIKLGLAGDHQFMNASVALELCKIFVQSIYNIDILQELNINEVVKGLETASWPARAQVFIEKEHKNIKWNLDGAHTVESLEVCTKWFKQVIDASPKERFSSDYTLIFNCTNGRQGNILLKPIMETLKPYSFKNVIFTTNTTYSTTPSNNKKDFQNNTQHEDKELNAQKDLYEAWRSLVPEFPENNIYIVESIEKAVEKVHELCSSENLMYNVLVTGSLHLVGGFLTVFGAEVV